MDRKQNRMVAYRLSACAVTVVALLCGCTHFFAGSPAPFEEANALFAQGNYRASLNRYEQIFQDDPAAGDRVLFEMGIIYAYPSNEQKDYQKSLGCFQRLLKDYPASRYRTDSAEMISHIDHATVKEKKIMSQQAQIVALEAEVRNKEVEVAALQKKIETYEREFKRKILTTPPPPVFRVLIEKSERRLSLISKDKVLKSYRIALGGDPKGPKQREGDNKTPEGIYVIDSRNRDSAFHQSLHISYPNEKDRKRAKEIGVSPGGNIMIHGIKNGLSWVGDLHREIDWTKGCIAVTDEEIEEIARLVPNGTTVEIRP